MKQSKISTFFYGKKTIKRCSFGGGPRSVTASTMVVLLWPFLASKVFPYARNSRNETSSPSLKPSLHRHKKNEEEKLCRMLAAISSFLAVWITRPGNATFQTTSSCTHIACLIPNTYGTVVVRSCMLLLFSRIYFSNGVRWTDKPVWTCTVRQCTAHMLAPQNTAPEGAGRPRNSPPAPSANAKEWKMLFSVSSSYNFGVQSHRTLPNQWCKKTCLAGFSSCVYCLFK